MKLSLIHLLASIAPLTALAGCAVAPGSAEESTGKASSEMVVSGVGGSTGGGIVRITDPTVLCQSTNAQDVNVPVFPNQNIATGYGDPTSSCDYQVTEIENTQGKALQVVLTDAPPNQLNWDKEWAATQSDCVSSYYEYDVFGYVLPHVVPSIIPGQITIVPGSWQTIHTDYAYGQWHTNGQCLFSELDSYGLPVYQSSSVPYGTVRVATKSYIAGPGYTHTLPIFTMVRP
jgi:hypothetical protein